jgi:hypothetical protein
MRNALRTAGNLLLVLLVIAIGEALPPLKALERWMWLERPVLLAVTGLSALLGIFGLVGGAVFRMVKDSTPLSRPEIMQHVKRMRDAQAAPYAYRVSKVFLPKQASGAGFSDQVSFAEFAAAWRAGLWLRDPRWFGMFVMAGGAALMTFGIFGLITVLATAGIKFLMLLIMAFIGYKLSAILTS